MPIDPITMALCRGDNSVGNVTIPYVNLTTPMVPFADPVKLTINESQALSDAWAMKCPTNIFVTVEGIGSFCSVFSFVGRYMFYGSLIVGDAVLTIVLEREAEPDTYNHFYFWNAKVSGGVLNPVE